MKSLDLQKNLNELAARIVWIYFGSLIFFVGFSVFTNQILKEQAASQATSFIRRMVKMGDFKETIITLSQAKLDYFQAVVYYDNPGTMVFSLPVDLDEKLLEQKQITNSLLYGYINTRLYFDISERNQLGTLIFAYGRFGYVKYALGLWLLLVLTTIPLILSARKAVARRYEKDMVVRAELARAALAKSVRHDIGSPLFSLQGFLSASKTLTTDERQVLGRIVKRIFGIIADLEDKPVSAGFDGREVSVADVIKEVIREKELQKKRPIQIGVRFEPSAFLAYTSMTRVQLSRILSNILDNSIHAISGSGKIEVSLRVALNTVILNISDTGKGIPSTILTKIFDDKFTYEKSKGSGIGLSTAKEAIELCEGKISASSEPGVGTNINIELPIRNQPLWWIDRIDTNEFSQIVVLDDQETSHDAWRMKLHGIKSCEYIFDPETFEKWLSQRPNTRTLFLVDLDLGPQKMSGIELIKKFNIAANSILVTGNYDDQQLRNQCSLLKLRLLPKPLIDTIPIQ